MAQIQEHYDPSVLYTVPSQPRSRYTFGLTSFAPLCARGSLTTEASMARPLFQRRFTPEDNDQQLQWPMSQTSSSGSLMSMQNQPWGQLSVSEDWTGLHNEPLVMSEMDDLMLASNNLPYNQIELQNAMNKPMDFQDSSSWDPSSLDNTGSVMVPSPSPDILLSPVSPFDNVKHTYSPGPNCSPVMSSHGSASYTMSPGAVKISSPSFAPPTPQSMIQRKPGTTAMQNLFGNPATPAGTFYMGNTVEQADFMAAYGSEESYQDSQCSSPVMAPWYPLGHAGGNTGVSYSPQAQQSGIPKLDCRPNYFLSPIDQDSRHRQPQWSNKSGVPDMSHFQNRFTTASTDDDKVQRMAEDETLLQMKQDGHTYKDIRKALGHKVAESTLRGRYRSLTKPRNHRVRAPKWADIDIILLKRYVQEEFDKFEVMQPSLDTKQKLDKVPWMKIVDLIVANGGTYKFGAATAKKKWVEISQSPRIRSSRRRSNA